MLLTVKDVSARLGLCPETVRRGILEGSLPGTAIKGTQDRMRFIIPQPAFELYVTTGITPMMLAQSICQAETIEQGVAIIRAVFEEVEHEN